MDYARCCLSILAMGQLRFPTLLAEDEVAGIAEMQDLIGSHIFGVTRLTDEFTCVFFVLFSERGSASGG